MISELVNFKNFVFSGDSGLSTTEIAVLFFIFCQDRKKFVFYKNVMKSALNIKDVRTLNHAIDSLIQKGLIKAARQMFRNVKGYIFSIVGIDTDCPAQNQIESYIFSIVGIDTDCPAQNQIESRPTMTAEEPEQKDVDCNYSEPVAENIEPVDVSVSDSDSGAGAVSVSSAVSPADVPPVDGSGVPVLELSTGRAVNRKPNQYDDIKDIQDMSDDEQNALQELMKGFAV